MSCSSAGQIIALSLSPASKQRWFLQLPPETQLGQGGHRLEHSTTSPLGPLLMAVCFVWQGRKKGTGVMWVVDSSEVMWRG